MLEADGGGTRAPECPIARNASEQNLNMDLRIARKASLAADATSASTLRGIDVKTLLTFFIFRAFL